MSTEVLTALALVSFIVFFIAIWLTVCYALSSVGGWRALATQFRSAASGSGKLYPFSSMGLGSGSFPVSYRGCVFVRLDPSGIALSVFPAFRFCHPRLFIPWQAVSECKRERLWFVDCTAVYVSQPPVRMLFWGRLGRDLHEFGNRPG